jgi:hypothetical protein
LAGARPADDFYDGTTDGDDALKDQMLAIVESKLKGQVIMVRMIKSRKAEAIR